MKKIIFIFLVIIIILMTPTVILTLINSQNDRIINGYYSSNEHFDDEGFQDYTEYCEYYYNKNPIEDLKTRKYKKVRKKDIAELNKYFKDYSQWIIYRKGYKDWYTFDYNKQIKVNDYYYIENKGSNDSSLIDKFVSYDIYYYDINKSTLYYFHTNI